MKIGEIGLVYVEEPITIHSSPTVFRTACPAAGGTDSRQAPGLTYDGRPLDSETPSNAKRAVTSAGGHAAVRFGAFAMEVPARPHDFSV